MKKCYPSWAQNLLIILMLSGSYNIVAQQEMFDDFNYSSNTDSELGNINQWYIIDGASGPPAGAIYSRELISFYDDPGNINNRIMGVATFANGTSASTRHSRIETADMSYRHGTFAARVYFDDTPQQYGDGNVETFYTIGAYATCSDANLYSEVDFEYLPWDAWDPNNRQQTMYYTNWETCNAPTSQRSDLSFQGWHNCVFTSMPGEPVYFYIDNALVATVTEGLPDADQNISFANWVVDNIVGSNATQRNTTMQVDWVYHIKDSKISSQDVLNTVTSLRGQGIIAKNISGQTRYGQVIQQSPFSSTPYTIPGTIEVENFDIGGEGIAFHDIDASNNGEQHRTSDGVDIEICTLGGYNVGWINAGEWLEYTVNIQSTGIYNLIASISSESGGTMQVEFNGANATGSINIPATGGWQSWASASANDIALNAGQQVMRIYMSSGAFNINNIIINSVTTPVLVTGISLSPISTTLNIGQTQQLTPNITPSNAANKNVNWTSSNNSIASVNNGLVTALNAGNATIVATTEDGGYTANANITVNGSTPTGEDITNLGGPISAQYSDSPSGEGINNLIDNNFNTKYLTFNASAWIQYQAPSDYIVTSYSITSANDHDERDPLNWTLQGSNDGLNWTTITNQSGIDFPNRFQTISFEFENSTSYVYYRFNLDNNTENTLQLAEFELFGTKGSSVYNLFIEAEDYVNMSGIEIEPCSEGGQNVGYIDATDWIVWDVNIPTSGTYTVEYRVASLDGGGSIHLQKAGGGVDYGTIPVPSTDGWQNWTTINHTVSLTAGLQQIAIYVPVGGYNLNWIQFTQGLKSAEAIIEEINVLDNLVIYPNPAKNILHIQGVATNSIIEIISITGQRIIETDRDQIDVSGLKSGVYFIIVRSEGSIVKKKFIKK